MEDHPSFPTLLQQPTQPSLQKSNFPLLYYGLVIIATAIIVVMLYNLVKVKWCAHFINHRQQPQRNSHIQHDATPMMWRIENSPINLLASFKYEGDGKGEDGIGDHPECAVCLSVFEKGEEIRQMPKCKHYFHAPCIDMWLYSHMDCPLCRSPVEPPPLDHQLTAEESEHSREGLLGPTALV